MRTPCPTCSCGFKNNRDLFPQITSSGVHQSLQKIRSEKALSQFFHNNGIQPIFEENDWYFGIGICTGVINKFRKKIQELNIRSPYDEYTLSNRDIQIPEVDFLLGKIPWNSSLEGIHNDE